jgi:NAD(P)-dependent dehydrogenase (short-subunit alcohol dehydrogenase family)
MTTDTGVLITGGAVRIGAAIARRFARDGYPVAVHCNRSKRDAVELVKRLRTDYGVEACVVSSDLSGSDLAHVLEQARAGLGGPLRFLVNSASAFEQDGIDNVDSDSFDLHMKVNLRAPVLLSQAFARQAPEGSAIINLLDQRVLRPTPRYFSYTLSKSALYTATRTMAQALAPRVRVNGVAPGLTLINARQDKSDYARRVASLPLARGGSPEEVADAVAFLATCLSVTGQTLAVDGGQHLAWHTPDISAG